MTRHPAARGSLAARIALLGVGIVLLTAVATGLLAAGVIRSAGANGGQRTLSELADLGVAIGPDRALLRVEFRPALRRAGVRLGLVARRGPVITRSPLVRDAARPQDLAALRQGGDVSRTTTVGTRTVYLEGRPLGDGRGLLLVQARADATAADAGTLRRVLLGLAISAAAAAAIGLVVAYRLARPLRRTAAAARELAAGRRDITLPAEGPSEVVAVSEAVTTLAAALRTSEGRQREFLLSVSHDLRTPLTALSGYAESLAGGVVPPERTAEVGAVMQREAHRLDRLVGDLLDLARLGAADLRIELTSADLVGLARSTAPVWADRTGAAGVGFVLEVPDGPVPVRTDPARLRQALDGLFDNALRVTPAGAPVVLAVRGEPGAAVVEVRDGGPGLTDDDLQVAFEQGALHRRYRGVREVGTGLGLAIVHGLVTRLGGRIEAGHAREGGARFTIRLPAG